MTEVPHYQDLDFIDLRAQASEASLSVSSNKQVRNDLTPLRKSSTLGKTVASFTANPHSNPFGCFCFNKLPFGISCAPELWCQLVEKGADINWKDPEIVR